MQLGTIDWLFVFAFFAVSLAVGVAVTRRAGKSSAEFFAAGRSMPWWLLGVSMVATTFSTDTPNLVASIVRQNGVAGNWAWWAFLLTGMLTVFVYARLWRRSGVLTDVEFYEIRYSGKSAAFLRGFRALYLGVVFNVVVMATVSLAAIKIGRVLLGLAPWQTIVIASVVTVVYSTLGGLRGVIITDFIQFGLAMFGSVAAAFVAVNHPAVGGMTGLLSNEAIQAKLSFLPDLNNMDVAVAIFIIPIAVQWWAAWYPGSEPGGGGYIAQRMLSAKNESHALGAVFFFNAAHYALRPWPWIIVALCSLVVYPDLNALREAFPQAGDVVNHDLGYPAMLTFLPVGLLGLVVASLIAAYMSTISTHLNWGSSYVVHDFYERFVRQESTEKELVLVGRVCTVVLMILAGALALLLEDALDSFKFILTVGAGTGLLFILRWFWWRINAISEIVAMTISFVVAVTFFVMNRFGEGTSLADWQEFLLIVGITTPCWILATFLSRPTAHERLVTFCKLAKPGGPGWRRIIQEARTSGEITETATGWNVPQGILCMVLGCIAIYSTLFATGYWLYRSYGMASVMTVVAIVATMLLVKAWRVLLLSGTGDAPADAG